MYWLIVLRLSPTPKYQPSWFLLKIVTVNPFHTPYLVPSFWWFVGSFCHSLVCRCIISISAFMFMWHCPCVLVPLYSTLTDGEQYYWLRGPLLSQEEIILTLLFISTEAFLNRRGLGIQQVNIGESLLALHPSTLFLFFVLLPICPLFEWYLHLFLLLSHPWALPLF